MQPISRLFSSTFVKFWSNWQLFFLIYFVAGVWSALEAFAEPDLDTAIISSGEWAVYLAALAIASVFSVLMSISLTYAMAGTATSVKGAYSMALRNFWRYLILAVVSVVIVTVGFLFLIVPGIVLSVWFVFAYFVLLLENEGVIASLKKSREYVRGHWWGVFARIAVFFLIMAGIVFALQLLITFIVSFLPAVLLAQIVYVLLTLFVAGFLTPFSLLYFYQMYLELKSGKELSYDSFQTAQSTV